MRAINGKRSISAVSAEYFNMKFKKVILVLTEDTDQMIITQVVKLCKKFKSKLFVLFVVEANRASRLARLTHQKTDILDQEIEESGWKLLYLVEDEAVESDVWTSLHLENGNLMDVLKKYIEAYDINTVFTKRKDETKEIFVSSP
ncbi:hypothetical protein GQ543_00420, partial [candidate division WOR-3 bacterium]|nr:hypothetical protein [candidate division WOR-3 bacterium]